MPAQQFALENNLVLHTDTWVTAIDRQTRQLRCGNRQFSYQKLVLAMGARAIVPQISGRELIFTFNSQNEYRQHQDVLQKAKRILVLGGGLIGTELAMDLHRAGKRVTLLDRAHSLLSSVMPAELSSRLQNGFSQMGITLALNNELIGVERVTGGVRTHLRSGQIIEVDAVIAAIGLHPEIALATAAGLKTQRGVLVNEQLQTSDEHIFALGDCCEMGGHVRPFLQPIQLGALTLAKNLLGGTESLRLPPMLVKVKTPDLPVLFAGETARSDLTWEIALATHGMLARGRDEQKQLRAFVATEEHTQQAFMLLRELSC